MTWPLEPTASASSPKASRTIVVVEEKRALIETQVKEQLYGTADAPARASARATSTGDWLFPANGALDPSDIAHRASASGCCKSSAASDRGARRASSRQAPGELAETQRRASARRISARAARTTRRPSARGHRAPRRHRLPLHGAVDGPRDRRLHPDGRRGRELDRPGAVHQDQHVFQNLGDGTYNHSGAAGDPRRRRGRRQHHLQDPVQRRRGDDRRPAASKAASPCRRSPASSRPKASSASSWSPTSRRNTPAATTCRPASRSTTATSSTRAARAARGPRRLRADLRPDLRGREAPPPQARRLPDPTSASFINELVCEGCGDCGVQSNCVSVQPLETEFGRKRQIDQSSCNKDFSCLKGFCPSFVTVHGAKDAQGAQASPARPSRCDAPAGAGAARARRRLSASSSPASAAPASSPRRACSAWRRISKARASAAST